MVQLIDNDCEEAVEISSTLIPYNFIVHVGNFFGSNENVAKHQMSHI